MIDPFLLIELSYIIYPISNKKREKKTYKREKKVEYEIFTLSMQS